MKKILLFCLMFISANSQATQTGSADILCVFPGHGGGCSKEVVELEKRSQSVFVINKKTAEYALVAADEQLLVSFHQWNDEDRCSKVRNCLNMSEGQNELEIATTLPRDFKKERLLLNITVEFSY